VVRPSLIRQVPFARLQDILDYHSSVEQAGATAARAGVRTLVCTHFVPALVAGQEDAWREQAARHFDGEIVLGADLTTVDASRRRPAAG
jgi:ribonuclease Z